MKMQQLSGGAVHAPAAVQTRPILAQRSFPSPVAPSLTTQTRSSRCSSTAKKDSESGGKPSSDEIYIGFVKEDGFGSREGRQGRFIKDDASKYPEKDDLGWFLGATGGWAGGEAALKSMIADDAKKVKAPIPVNPPPVKYDGDDVIYMGYDKGDDGLKVRKSGAKGRIILDDASRYPQKEDLGGLLGATGGFAGGEVGLKSFAATGELRLRKPNEYGAKKQFNPLGLAAILVVGGAGGGVALDLAFNAGSSLVNAKLLASPIDDNTKTLLLAAVGLVAVSGLLLAGRSAVISLQEKLSNSVQNVAVTGAFGVLVVLVAIAVLEN